MFSFKNVAYKCRGLIERSALVINQKHADLRPVCDTRNNT